VLDDLQSLNPEGSHRIVDLHRSFGSRPPAPADIALALAKVMGELVLASSITPYSFPH
jgi:hypothetical protein